MNANWTGRTLTISLVLAYFFTYLHVHTSIEWWDNVTAVFLYSIFILFFCNDSDLFGIKRYWWFQRAFLFWKKYICKNTVMWHHQMYPVIHNHIRYYSTLLMLASKWNSRDCRCVIAMRPNWEYDVCIRRRQMDQLGIVQPTTDYSILRKWHCLCVERNTSNAGIMSQNWGSFA